MEQLSIVSLNVHHGQGAFMTEDDPWWSFFYSRANMKKNALGVAESLKKLSPAPDIICFQEANNIAPHWADITTNIRVALGFGYNAEAYKGLSRHANVIISRLPFARVRSFQFSKLMHWQYGVKSFFTSFIRGCIGVDIAGWGVVVSLHLDSDNPALRHAQLQDVFRKFNADEIVVLAGDFNTYHYGEPVTELAARRDFKTMPALSPQEFSLSATWPAGKHEHSPVRASARHDYVFVRAPYRIVSSRRFLTGYSDHWGVHTVIEQ